MSNDGKDLELLVQLIERSIDPDATVEHNVFLPVLTSTSGRTRQCDIIIRQGKPPRETLTIVEVQDRNSAVTIGNFGDWMKKLKDVGAQHLICVSRQDFPDSIKEEVMQSGNTVRLITLKEMPKDSLPTSFGILINNTIFKMLKIEISFTDKDLFDSLGLPQNSGEMIKVEEPLFTFDKNSTNLISLLDICKASLSKEDKEGDGSKSIQKNQLWHYKSNMLLPIRLKVDFAWTLHKEEIPMNIFSYEQDQYGSLAWIAKNITTLDGIPVEISFLLIYKDNIWYLNKLLMRKIQKSTV